jgi:predicted RNA polymerase sigma factor
MFLLNRTADALPEPGTAEFDQTMQAYGAALEALGQAGVLIDCAAQLQRWAQLHIARAELLKRLGRTGEAVDVYSSALELEPAPATRSFLARRIRELSG